MNHVFGRGICRLDRFLMQTMVSEEEKKYTYLTYNISAYNIIHIYFYTYNISNLYFQNCHCCYYYSLQMFIYRIVIIFKIIVYGIIIIIVVICRHLISKARLYKILNSCKVG